MTTTTTYNVLAPADRAEHWKAVTRQQERLAKRFAGSVRITLTRALNAAARDLARGLPPSSTFDLSGLKDIYDDMYRGAALPFARRTFETIERSLKRAPDDLLFEWDEEITQMLLRHGAERINLVRASIERDVIARVMAEAHAEGWSSQRAARELRAKWDGLKTHRAMRIARTEVISATNAGTMMGAQAIEDRLDIPLLKSWLATPGKRTRTSHRDAGAKYRAKPIPMNEPFIVGGEALMQPGDPSGAAREVINCRCTVTFEIDEEASNEDPLEGL